MAAAARVPRTFVCLISPRLCLLPNLGTRLVSPGSRQLSTAGRGGGQYSNVSRGLTAGGGVIVATLSGYAIYRAVLERRRASEGNVVLAKGYAAEEETKQKAQIQSQRELRFLSFASVEYEGNIYMTPQDFLESVAEENPRPRTTRRHLRQAEVERYLKDTPPRWKGSSSFFRKLLDKGIFSYTEYLFLLCVLTKPRSGFQIAFNMFDTDGDQRVDKKEFLVLEHLMASGSSRGSTMMELTELYPFVLPKSTGNDRSNIWKLMKESISLLQDFYTMNKLNADAILETESVGQTSVKFNIWKMLQERHPDHTEESSGSVLNNTTLTVHFFGAKGKDVLNYDDFHRFMDNLQTEVLELEFNEFSHGMPVITEEEFARVLLRYTMLTKEAHNKYLERLRKRIPHVQGISFKDFKEFCQFLNNLDDFNLAMRIYTYNDRPISEVDFQRAVKACTGQSLNAHLIHVVFQLFDEDGDGRLSHQEFISVMKERLHRGARPIGQNRWESYRGCVRNIMRTT